MRHITTQEKIGDLVCQIKELQDEYDVLSWHFRNGIYDPAVCGFDSLSADDWRRSVFGDALVKLRLLIENNFNLLETISLVATTRYIFEICVWLFNIDKDNNLGLFYALRLANSQLEYYKATLTQFQNEIRILKQLQKDESENNKNTIAKILDSGNITSEEISAAMSHSMEGIDKLAARKFLIYAEEAKTNGYGFQAHLISEQLIPKVEKSIVELENQLLTYKNKISKNKQKSFPKHFKWNVMAKNVGMESEYDYIYKYTSKLLHATPSSITTDEKNLEEIEMYIFLRYIHVKLQDIIELSKRQPEVSNNPYKLEGNIH